MKKAIYPGTFDPITNGHIDILTRALKIFDYIVLAIPNKSTKKPLFNVNERVKLLKKVTYKIKNVEVFSFDGLMINFAKKYKISAIVRGLRNISDFSYELKLAYMNRHISPQLESVFFIPSAKISFISSSLIKDIARCKGDFQDFIPSIIYQAMIKKYNDK